jgi:hypothetical protein
MSESKQIKMWVCFLCVLHRILFLCAFSSRCTASIFLSQADTDPRSPASQTDFAFPPQPHPITTSVTSRFPWVQFSASHFQHRHTSNDMQSVTVTRRVKTKFAPEYESLGTRCVSDTRGNTLGCVVYAKTTRKFCGHLDVSSLICDKFY